METRVVPEVASEKTVNNNLPIGLVNRNQKAEDLDRCHKLFFEAKNYPQAADGFKKIWSQYLDSNAFFGYLAALLAQDKSSDALEAVSNIGPDELPYSGILLVYELRYKLECEQKQSSDSDTRNRAYQRLITAAPLSKFSNLEQESARSIVHNSLACIFYRERRFELSQQWLQLPLETNSLDAQFLQALQRSESGDNTQSEAARVTLRTLADKHIPSRLSVAIDDFRNGECKKGLVALEKLVIEKHPLAQYELGLAYIQGGKLLKNEEKGLSLIKEAASQKVSKAQFLYAKKIAVTDPLLASRLFFESIEHPENMETEFTLAWLCVRTIVPTDCPVSCAPFEVFLQYPEIKKRLSSFNIEWLCAYLSMLAENQYPQAEQLLKFFQAYLDTAPAAALAKSEAKAIIVQPPAHDVKTALIPSPSTKTGGGSAGILNLLPAQRIKELKELDNIHTEFLKSRTEKSAKRYNDILKHSPTNIIAAMSWMAFLIENRKLLTALEYGEKFLRQSNLHLIRIETARLKQLCFYLARELKQHSRDAGMKERLEDILLLDPLFEQNSKISAKVFSHYCVADLLCQPQHSNKHEMCVLWLQEAIKDQYQFIDAQVLWAIAIKNIPNTSLQNISFADQVIYKYTCKKNVSAEYACVQQLLASRDSNMQVTGRQKLLGLAEVGNHFAQYEVARKIMAKEFPKETSVTVTPDITQALAWSQKAADRKHPPSEFLTAYLLAKAASPNCIAIYSRLMSSAQGGFAVAQYILGVIYLRTQLKAWPADAPQETGDLLDYVKHFLILLQDAGIRNRLTERKNIQGKRETIRLLENALLASYFENSESPLTTQSACLLDFANTEFKADFENPLSAKKKRKKKPNPATDAKTVVVKSESTAAPQKTASVSDAKTTVSEVTVAPAITMTVSTEKETTSEANTKTPSASPAPVASAAHTTQLTVPAKEEVTSVARPLQPDPKLVSGIVELPQTEHVTSSIFTKLPTPAVVPNRWKGGTTTIVKTMSQHCVLRPSCFAQDKKQNVLVIPKHVPPATAPTVPQTTGSVVKTLLRQLPHSISPVVTPLVQMLLASQQQSIEEKKASLMISPVVEKINTILNKHLGTCSLAQIQTRINKLSTVETCESYIALMRDLFSGKSLLEHFEMFNDDKLMQPTGLSVFMPQLHTHREKDIFKNKIYPWLKERLSHIAKSGYTKKFDRFACLVLAVTICLDNPQSPKMPTDDFLNKCLMQITAKLLGIGADQLEDVDSVDLFEVKQEMLNMTKAIYPESVIADEKSSLNQATVNRQDEAKQLPVSVNIQPIPPLLLPIPTTTGIVWTTAAPLCYRTGSPMMVADLQPAFGERLLLLPHQVMPYLLPAPSQNLPGFFSPTSVPPPSTVASNPSQTPQVT